MQPRDHNHENAPGRRVQLHRAVAKLGWGSRGQAWQWIAQGRVTVDGLAVTDPLTWIDLDLKEVRVDGQPAPQAEVLVLALHKPPGVVVSRRDDFGRPTVYDLLPPGLPRVFAVGRLDADSEGLLILTNDGQLSFRLHSPESHVPKTYHVTLRGRPTQESLAAIAEGVELSDGPTRPVRVRVLEEGEKTTVVEMILTEGRNRQIRRMWKALGHKVRRLVRVAIGGFHMGDLPAGACRKLEEDEVRRLSGGG